MDANRAHDVHCKHASPGNVEFGASTPSLLESHQMIDLLTQVLNAHGGLERWNRFNSVTATIVTGGGLWAMKGLIQDPNPREMTVALHEESASVSPFGRPDWRTAFTPSHIAIESTSGEIVRERHDPRAHYSGHVMNTPWEPLDRAYFNGYAMWTYLTTPFLLSMPGVAVTEIPPLNENGEVWRGLRAHFPEQIATHSTEQDFYFGPDFLLRRHDYVVEISGGSPAAQYVYEFAQVEGLYFPTKRRAYLRGPDMNPVRDLLLVSIDLSNFRFG
jgi:hypothetical protein